MVRIDQFISNQTSYSRKEAKELIKKGKVIVDGTTIKNDGFKFDENASEVFINGHQIVFKLHYYLMLNKPEGYITATEDKNNKTVLDLIPADIKKRVFPVGRLDIDTTGLLLLTDDGDFSHKIISPKSDIKKTYLATTKGIPSKDAESILELGIEFKEFTSLPAKLIRISENLEENTAVVKLIISEGKFHQVKRMLHHVGADVVTLKRLAIGDVVLDENLLPGNYRELTEEEINKLC